MMRYLVIFGLLLSAALPLHGASRVQGLYQAQVPVADRGSAERERALVAALRDVTVRVAGSADAASSPNLPDSAAEIDRLVQQYGYRDAPDGLQLQVRFDDAATERLLRQLGVPIWGEERPTTLVWLVVQDGAERRLLGADAPGVAGQALRDAAGTRAVPVLLPLLDLEDQSRVRFGDVWGGFFDSVLSASERYAADAILIGRLHRQSGGWTARWTLHNRGQTRQWSASTDELTAAAASGIEGLADTLAGRYAAGSGADDPLDRIRLRVDDVRSLDDYAQLSQFLGSRELVNEAQLLAVAGDQAYYELAVRGSPDRLRRSLGLWQRLALVAPATTDGTDAAAPMAELHFRLVP